MTKQLYVGLDVGGTTVKQGVFSPEGEMLGSLSVPTPPLVDGAGYLAVTNGLDQLVKSVDATIEEVLGIGLAVPCPVPAEGLPKFVANMKLDLIGMQNALEAHCPNAVVRYVNDANAAAMGEVWRGGAQGLSSCVMVTLGTGVGGGVVIDGKVCAGAFGAGGEIGHITVMDDEDEACGCGRHGCLEQYASAKGVVRLYRQECVKRGQAAVELSGPTDTLSLFGAWQAGDEAARAAVSTMCDRLGFALAMISCVVDPERYVIGGGVAGALPLFGDELRERYAHYALASSAETPIVAAQLGNDAGSYGAAYTSLLAAQE